MRIHRFGPGARAGEIRALSPPRPEVEEEVRAIVDEVRRGGDAAVRRLTERFDRARVGPEEIAVPAAEIEAAVATLEAPVLAALRTAIANVRAVAVAGLAEPRVVSLPEGQRVELTDQPVRRVGAYVPGGRMPYPSTVVMCAITAQAAGVDEVAVCAPPGPEGRAHPTILAACYLCRVTEVYRMGGAQAVAALAHGTATVRPVDVVVGPGNAYVQEAKRQLVGSVGIDSVAGPSELVVVASGEVDAQALALDLLAQAEHGPDSPLALISAEPALLRAVAGEVERLKADRPSVSDASLALVEAGSARAAVELADEVAPEHLQLIGSEVEAHAARVRSAGCLFIGRDAATAFGDYVTGSNHVLPTGGAARHSGALSVSTFRRRMARVSLPEGAAARLAPAGAALARAEGFPVHAESMTWRAGAPGDS